MRLTAAGVAFALAWTWTGLAAQQERINPQAQILAEYKKRIDDYMTLRRKALEHAPPLEQSDDPAKIQAARDARTAAIRAARANAAQGDIFTPEARPLFRGLLSPETKGSMGADTKRTIKEDAPAKMSFKVNASYPEDQPLPTVPPNVLASLPRLPEGLEYRIVRGYLVLRDVDANLIVDVLPNAIPQ